MFFEVDTICEVPAMYEETYIFCVFCTFVDLMKHKRYEIRMSVYNAVGEGPTSSPQEVFVGEAGKNFYYLYEVLSLLTNEKEQNFTSHRCSLTVPTAPPQNVIIQSATATQFDVTWDPPPLETQNGDIQGYKVRL